VSTDYFRTMGIPLVRGRWFRAADSAEATRVVLVNEAFAREFFPGEDPVGRRIIYSSRRQNDAREIVGVVGDVRHFGLARNAPAEFYTPQPQPPSYHGMTIVIRAPREPAALVPDVRQAVRALAPDVPIYGVKTLPDLVEGSVDAARFRTELLGLFAALAIGLAVVGTYGVVSLLVSQRVQEIGVRMALGASRRDILDLVVGRGIQPVAIGTLAGLGGGYLLARAIEGLLFQVSPADPVTLAIAALVIMLAGLLASWIPARRACRVDPVVALKTE
jgi:putative ABC transport system permease protein